MNQMSPAAINEAPQRPQLPNQSSNSHNRSSSFFSFRNKHDSANSTPQRSPSILTRSPNSNNGNPNALAPQMSRQSANSQPYPQPSQPAQPAKPPQPKPLHPEIRSVVQLTVAHAHKIYFSGPLIRRIERQPDGQRPSKDDGWVEVWAQLGGTTLSIWDMGQVQQASQAGTEVPPSYINTTDAVRSSHLFTRLKTEHA